jgi:nicotinamide riboside kinase
MDELKANGSSAFYVESWIDPNPSSIKSLWAWPDPEEVPLQIGITGTAGTGKRRLARALGKRLDIPVIEGVVRNVKEMGFKINKDARWLDEFAIMLGQIWEQMEYTEYVSAGTVIDLVAHVQYFVDQYGTKREKNLLRALANFGNTVANNDYTVTFYLPLDGKPKSDGVRSVDMKYLREIDNNIRYYLNAYDLDYFPIKGTSKEKLDVAYSYLEDFGLLFDRD